MGTNQDAFAALNAELFVPDRNLLRDISFFPHRRARRERAVHGHRAHRQIVSSTRDHATNHIPHEGRRTLGNRRQNSQPAGRSGGNGVRAVLVPSPTT